VRGKPISHLGPFGERAGGLRTWSLGAVDAERVGAFEISEAITAARSDRGACSSLLAAIVSRRLIEVVCRHARLTQRRCVQPV
jgi:hypothetical protein